MYTLQLSNNKVFIAAPYHPDFPAMARDLGGKFANGQWVFDARDHARAQEIANSVYGIPGEQVRTIRLHLTYCGARELWIAGRRVLARTARDSRPTLGEGCVVIAGKFDRSSGSRNNPTIGNGPLVIEIRDLPASLVDAELADHAKKPEALSQNWYLEPA